MQMQKRAKNIIRAVSIAVAVVMSVFLVVTVVQYNNENNDGIQVLSKLGSRGDEVRAIQKKLKSLGYYTGSVDGIYGVGTRNAVKAFQRNCGITADGIAGSKTLLYLGLDNYSSNYSTADINLLAKIISAEARGETYTGQVAVGAVVLNRVASSSFPDTISGVIYQKGAFDAVRDSNWSKAVTASAKKAAQDAINGWDPTGGALYYYNPKKTSNKWIRSRPVIKTIGNHVFCK